MNNIIYIPYEFNSKDGLKIGIIKGNVSLFIKNIIEHRDDLNNACIVTSTFDTFIKLFESMRVEYQTEDAYYNGNIIYIKDKCDFCKLCLDKSDNIYKAWMGVMREISNDIDTMEERYSAFTVGKFLRSMLVYFSAFTIAEKLRS